VQTNNEKTKSNKKTCLKSSVVVALQQERKMSFLKKLMISKRNHKLESAVQGVANGVNTAKLAKESHLRRRKRMRLAVMPADV
jgi:hypothetical protein